MKPFIFLAVLALLTTGCIPKQSSKPKQVAQTQKPAAQTAPRMQKKLKSTSYLVTMRTQKFAFSDTGFLVQYTDMQHLNVLAAGKPVLDLKVKKSDDICVGALCNTKQGFNQSFLSGDYPDDLVENVLSAQPIFGGVNVSKTTDGFLQILQTPQYDIRYQVSGGNIAFRDTQNNIILKLKPLQK